MHRATTIAVIAAFGVGGLIAAAALLKGSAPDPSAAVSPRPIFAETQWPFPIDQWGKGKAFRCTAADCGSEVMLYLRAKIGFCNCTTGVADDDELTRISDLELMGGKPEAVGDGRPIRVGWVNGRSRTYELSGSNRSALSVGFNERCDAIVATVVLGHRSATAVEPGVIAFLNGDTVKRWAQTTLGL